MLVLLLTVSLMAEPSTCKVEQVPFVEFAGTTDCLFQGQFRAAEYIAQHPGWMLVRYECGAPKT